MCCLNLGRKQRKDRSINICTKVVLTSPLPTQAVHHLIALEEGGIAHGNGVYDPNGGGAVPGAGADVVHQQHGEHHRQLDVGREEGLNCCQHQHKEGETELAVDVPVEEAG